ncbi:G-protein coupled receptor Mth2-like isoform X10 [Diabrotica virgifera virgifera]|uniref:G-protein coupled receptor Mth2-like n=1 Tax=Diabrotica virgifera virgifera TaxID=50390 RepID=A0ABM5KWW1_DIAVI|nr:G-protein coupled receptor Mth2-like isoform X10 [Diabrotica virgifera virgifera]
MPGTVETFFLLLSFYRLIGTASSELDLCDVTGSTDYTNYTSEITQNCGCIDNDNTTCIRKCCQLGFYHHHVEEPRYGIYESVCIKNESASLNFSVPIYNNESIVYYETDFVIGMLGCNEGEFYRYFKLNNTDPSEKFYVQENGTLFFKSKNKYYSNDRFCVDEDEGLSVFLCYSSPNPSLLQRLNKIGMIISMPFLLLTFLVYLLLPERNLHRRALMSYVFTLLAAYITLVTIQLYSGQFPDTTCHVLGYLIIFFFLVSFFWMNVMCVDMWLAFSGMRTFLSKKTAERKRFIIYCIYAWGMPIVHVLIVFLINHYGSTDTSWNPQIGVKRCFLGEGMPTFYYFYLPMAILIGINITLFVLTTVRIQKIKKETSMLKQTDSRRHTYEDDKQKFNLYLKLMFAMGVNWITELVSWAVDYAFSETPAYVWYITDFTNAMYGVLIFLIFVFKKKIWRSLKKKYYICIGKPHLAHSMTTSSARGTRTSNYSTTDTTAVSTDYRLSDMKNGKIPEESALNRT